MNDERFVFGPGLVNAHELEQYAFYPRVLVAEDVIKIAQKYPFYINSSSSEVEKNIIEYMLSTDLDGLKYIDYFNLVEDSFENTTIDMDTYYRLLKNTILEIHYQKKI